MDLLLAEMELAEIDTDGNGSCSVSEIIKWWHSTGRGRPPKRWVELVGLLPVLASHRANHRPLAHRPLSRHSSAHRPSTHRPLLAGGTARPET